MNLFLNQSCNISQVLLSHIYTLQTISFQKIDHKIYYVRNHKKCNTINHLLRDRATLIILKINKIQVNASYRKFIWIQ